MIKLIKDGVVKEVQEAFVRQYRALGWAVYVEPVAEKKEKK